MRKAVLKILSPEERAEWSAENDGATAPKAIQTYVDLTPAEIAQRQQDEAADQANRAHAEALARVRAHRLATEEYMAAAGILFESDLTDADKAAIRAEVAANGRSN